MLKHVLVIAPNGLCIIERQYEKLNVDSQLLSGFLSAVLPHMAEFGMTMDNIHDQMIGDSDTVLEFYNENGFICVGLTTNDANSKKIQSILEEINAMVYSQFGIYDPMHYSTIPAQMYEFIEDHIDVLLTKKGISTSSQNRDEFGLLPIISQVTSGRMNPKKAGKMILDWLKSGDLNDKEIENMKNSLNFVDKLLSQVQTGRLDDLQVLIRSTVQGVSKLTVRMDDAFSF